MFGTFRDMLYSNSFTRDYNGDGLITSSDFREGAYKMGLGSIGADVAQSAFNLFDRNHNGYLDVKDANGAFASLYRLYN